MSAQPTRGELAAELSPEEHLIRAVFCLARRDLRSKNAQTRDAAEAFFRGHLGSLRLWCELAGLEITVVQRNALSGPEKGNASALRKERMV
jgi:hypothetical protein